MPENNNNHFEYFAKVETNFDLALEMVKKYLSESNYEKSFKALMYGIFVNGILLTEKYNKEEIATEIEKRCSGKYRDEYQNNIFIFIENEDKLPEDLREDLKFLSRSFNLN